MTISVACLPDGNTTPRFQFSGVDYLRIPRFMIYNAMWYAAFLLDKRSFIQALGAAFDRLSTGSIYDSCCLAHGRPRAPVRTRERSSPSQRQAGTHNRE